MMAQSYLLKYACLGLICTLATSSMAGNEVVSLTLAQMSEEQLVETLADPKQGDGAFSEIVGRLERCGYDSNSLLAKRLADTWKATDAGSIVGQKSFQALCILKSQEVVDVLCRQLSKGATRRERVLAAHSLGQIGGETETAVDALRSAVAEDQGVLGEGRSIARESITALGYMGSAGAEALMAIWGNEIERRDCEEAVITAMGQTKEKMFTPILIDLLQGQQEALRDNASWALGEIANATALPVLKKYEKDPNAQVRENVVRAIGKIQQSTAAGK